jgi:hypothetical protein
MFAQSCCKTLVQGSIGQKRKGLLNWQNNLIGRNGTVLLSLIKHMTAKLNYIFGGTKLGKKHIF